eukprot:1933555-Amphidinium_carterae.1
MILGLTDSVFFAANTSQKPPKRPGTYACASIFARAKPGECHIVVAVLLSTVFTASLTITTHSKLLDCNAKASNAIVLEPHLGKPDPYSSISFTSRICASVPKSSME